MLWIIIVITIIVIIYFQFLFKVLLVNVYGKIGFRSRVLWFLTYMQYPVLITSAFLQPLAAAV